MSVFQMRREAATNDLTKKETTRLARASLMVAWQQRWDNDGRRRWTHRLISNLNQWCSRPHRDLSFHLTQLLTGHGCFNSYLFEIQKVLSAKCSQCGHYEDDAEHTLFHCPSWAIQRQEATLALGTEFNLTNVRVALVASDEIWDILTRYAKAVVPVKERQERARQAT